MPYFSTEPIDVAQLNREAEGLTSCQLFWNKYKKKPELNMSYPFEDKTALKHKPETKEQSTEDLIY